MGPRENALEGQQRAFRDDDGDGLPDEIEGVALGMEYATLPAKYLGAVSIADALVPAGEFLYLEQILYTAECQPTLPRSSLPIGNFA